MHTITENLVSQLRAQGLQIFQYLVEHSADAILMTNANLQIAHANHACNQLISRSIIGDPLQSIWYEADLPIFHHIIESAQIGSFFFERSGQWL